MTGLINAIRSHVMALPDLAKFAVVIAVIVGVPRQRMLDDTMLNAVLVLMLATSILGPVLTERFAPGMLKGAVRDTRQASA